MHCEGAAARRFFIGVAPEQKFLIMARNRFGTDILGRTGSMNKSAGGMTYMKNNVMRVRNIPTNPQTDLQQLIRAAFTSIGSKWKTQTEANRTLWEVAKANPYWAIQDEFTGTSRQPASGKDLFILVNFNLNQSTDSLGAPTIVTTSPSVDEPTDEFSITSIVADDSSNSLTLTYTQTGTNEVLVAKVSPALSPGNMRLTSVKSKLRGFTTVGASPATIAKVDSYSGQTGQKVFYVIEAINLTSGKKRLIASGNTIVVA